MDVGGLLGRMTPVEKVQQLTGISAWRALDDNGRLDVGRITPKLVDGVGQISRPFGSAKTDPAAGAAFVNEVQRFLVEDTRLGIPAIMHDEALSGFQTYGATVFPQSIGMACTWDPELMAEITTVIRRQMRAVGVHQALSPVLDVLRDPRWGRVEETYGEDRYLVSRMALAFVQGLQGEDPATGVMATLKHFAGYSFSEGGRNMAPVHVGPRELRETFLFPFEVAVREGRARAVMNSYSEIDGVPANASRELLTTILREEWGFDGLVVSDYSSIDFLITQHCVAADRKQAAVISVLAGLDTELPDRGAYGQPLLAALNEGLVSWDVVDALVARVLDWKDRLGLFDMPFVDESAAAAAFDTPADRGLARRAAQRSIVLLENDGGLLPLRSDTRAVAVIGPNADRVRGLEGDYAYTVHLESVAGMDGRGGDRAFDSVPVVTVLDGIRARVGERTEVRYAQGCDVDGSSVAGIPEAVAAAQGADVAVVVVGDQSGVIADGTVGEGRDSATLRLPGVQEELIRAVHATGTPVVVVLTHGRPFVLGWVAEHVSAIVSAWYPGEEGGNAVADVLFGAVNPGAKLCVTMPAAAGHQPFPYDHRRAGFHQYVDIPLDVTYPFGHGLSYTTFEYRDLEIEHAADEVLVTCSVANTGPVAGDEIVQLYVRDVVASVSRPGLELKGFRRVTIDAGGRARLRFRLPIDLLALYDRDLRLVVEPGEFEVKVGASSADIRLTGSFTLDGDVRPITGDRRFETAVELL